MSLWILEIRNVFYLLPHYSIHLDEKQEAVDRFLININTVLSVSTECKHLFTGSLSENKALG